MATKKKTADNKKDLEGIDNRILNKAIASIGGESQPLTEKEFLRFLEMTDDGTGNNNNREAIETFNRLLEACKREGIKFEDLGLKLGAQFPKESTLFEVGGGDEEK